MTAARTALGLRCLLSAARATERSDPELKVIGLQLIDAADRVERIWERVERLAP